MKTSTDTHPRGTAMTLAHILSGTPLYIWALLAALVALGVGQLRTRELPAWRVRLVPLALLAWSFSGAATSYGWRLVPVGAWLAGLVLAFVLARSVLPAPRATWDAALQRFRIAGSAWPLALLLGLFAVKYVAGAWRALQPAVATAPLAAAAFSLAFGLFAGVFASRNLAVLQARRARDGAGALALHA